MDRRHKGTHQFHPTAARTIQKILQRRIRQTVRVKTGAFIFDSRKKTFRRDFQMNTDTEPIVRLISMTNCIHDRLFE